MLDYFDLKAIAGLVVFVLLLLLFGLVFEVRKSIATQKLRNQKSWVWYMWLVVVTAPIWVSLVSICLFNVDKETASLGSLFLFFLALVFICWYRMIRRVKLKDFSPRRFAAGAVGKDGDMLNFKDSAESVARRLLSN